jgi:hypothetical protein
MDRIEYQEVTVYKSVSLTVMSTKRKGLEIGKKKIK